VVKYFLQKNDPYGTNTNQTLSFFQNFNKFTDLYMGCNQMYNTTSSVQFRPNKRLIIDESLFFGKLITSTNLALLNTLVFSNTKGVDLNSKIIKKYMSALVFVYSEFEIYSNGTFLNECSRHLYNRKYSNIITKFKSIYFRQVIYPKTICSLIFRNSSLEIVFFADITNSFLVKNRIRLVDDASNNTRLDDVRLKSLKVIYLELSYERLTSSILNVNLFQNVKVLYLIGVLESIETELFANFSHLKSIEFKINNLNEIFHQDTKWMSYLNRNIRVNLSSASEISRKIHLKEMFILAIYSAKRFQSFVELYSYPNEDICLFKDFPHSHLVFALIFPYEKLNCTCTLKWLYLYTTYLHNKTVNDNYSFFDIYASSENSSNIFYNCQVAFEKIDCNFEEIFLNCNLKKTTKIDKQLNDIDLFFLIKKLEYTLVLILQPTLCLLAMSTNLLVILVIRNNKNHIQLKYKMYKYATINAVFNIAYSTLILLKLINTCVFSYSQTYQCSSVYQDNFSQYFKIIGVYFLSNIFKSCSNISYIFFSMSRYISISLETNNRFFIWFSRINIKLFVLVSLLLSTILSVFILFQYEINEVYDYRKEFPFEKRDGLFCLDSELNKSSCKLFNIFKLVNQSFNGILFLTFTVFIDIFLVYTFRKEMKQKSKLEVNKNKSADFTKKMDKVTKMVLINSFFYSISHAPIFITTLLLIIYSKTMVNFCTERISCDLINEEANVFILVSMILNYLIFLYFNKNFEESFRDLKNYVISKIF